ncbi:helix-turn-helix domain-containing protein [Shimazuella kribbensis]|uniref:helix-turn-helix domain-containing protein n=1 Tax=Shimazuella kribbensis TaxID=139808 RepID=UPI000407D5C7|nr:helix-turn-helix transcriptional regulator [Shimazuella kribbensis]
MISFKPLRIWMAGQGKEKTDLAKDLGLNARTYQRIWKDGNVTTETIDRICECYNLPIEKVVIRIPNKKQKSST